MTRLPGEDLYSGMTPAQRAAQKLMEEYATLNDATTRREEWMAVQAIVTGTIPIVGEGVNETIDFGLTNKKTLTGDNKWGGTKADILGNLGDWTDAVLHGGFANVDTIIMGKTAKAKFFADANHAEDAGQPPHEPRRDRPRDLPNGVKYLGHLNDPSLDMYVYGEVYYDDWTNPDAPETKPLIPDNMIIPDQLQTKHDGLRCLHLHDGASHRPRCSCIIPTAAWWSCRRTQTAHPPTRWIAGWWRGAPAAHADMALFELKQEYSGWAGGGAAPPLTFKDCAAADIDTAFF